MNYLVMSTPVLAYALAKASEQGFVTFASGLSQALQGSSRAAGTFANQQALSTKSEISSPRGDEVIAYGAGQYSRLSTSNINGTVQQRQDVGTSFDAAQQYTVKLQTGSVGTINQNGHIDGVDYAAINASSTNSKAKQLTEGVEEKISNFLKTSEGQKWLSTVNDSRGVSFTKGNADNTTFSYNIGSGFGSGTDISSGRTTVDSNTHSGSIGGNVNVGDGKGNKIGGGLSTGMETNYSSTANSNRSYGDKFSSFQGYSYQDTDVSEIMKNESLMASLQKAMETSKSKEFQDAASEVKAYNEVKSFQASYGVNTETQLTANYMKAHNLHGVEGFQQAMAAIDKMGADGNYGELSKYSGVGDYSGMNRGNSGVQGPNYTDYFDTKSVRQDYINNSQQVGAQFQNSKNSQQPSLRDEQQKEAARIQNEQQSTPLMQSLKSREKNAEHMAAQGDNNVNKGSINPVTQRTKSLW